MNNKKICCFYISTYHLFTIILPYINEKIKEGKNVELLLQKDLSDDLKRYVKNVKSLNLDVNKIINLGWNRNGEITEKNNNVDYIIVGDEIFISNYENIMIENEINSDVLSCYKMNNNLEISKVLLGHDELLTTRRLKTISKFSQNEQKRKTIKSQ